MIKLHPNQRILADDLNANFLGLADATQIKNKVINQRILKTEAWTNVTYKNSWVTYSSDWYPVSYMKDNFDMVHLRGLCRFGTTANSVICTLPTGYRPSKNVAIAVMTGSGQHSYLSISSNGDVRQNETYASTAYCSVSGVSFRAEQ